MGGDVADTFGKEDCVHFEESDSSCKIKKGCGSGGVYCRPMWTNTKCYTQEKPNSIPDEYSHRIYAHGNTIVLRGKDGKCWQLTCGDYMGVLPEEELIFIKKALLSD
jgi:hypothetical protein